MIIPSSGSGILEKEEEQATVWGNGPPEKNYTLRR